MKEDMVTYVTYRQEWRSMQTECDSDKRGKDKRKT